MNAGGGGSAGEGIGPAPGGTTPPNFPAPGVMNCLVGVMNCLPGGAGAVPGRPTTLVGWTRGFVLGLGALPAGGVIGELPFGGAKPFVVGVGKGITYPVGYGVCAPKPRSPKSHWNHARRVGSVK